MKVNYNDISKIYDLVRKEEENVLRLFLDEIEITGSFSILDVGCGTGNYTNLLQRLTKKEVFGLDSSSGMLEKARQKNYQVSFVLGSAIEIPFEDNKFDFVYMTDVIHHIKDVNQMFKEFYRILKTNGKVCVMTQSHHQIDMRYMSEFFPETADVDKKRYPDINQIINSATNNNLLFLKTQIVEEEIACRLDQNFLELIEKKGYSMLHLIDDVDYLKGLEIVREEIPCIRKSAGCTLVWFKK